MIVHYFQESGVMKSGLFIPTSLMVIALCVGGVAHGGQSRGQNAVAVYSEDSSHTVRKNQALGRIIVADDATHVLYEWSRPYEWQPDSVNIPTQLMGRQRTFLYKVHTPKSWRDLYPPRSEDLFPPSPGATYFLGNFSPDSTMATFYEFSWDKKVARAGVVRVSQDAAPDIIWFDIAPDVSRLDHPAIWLSGQEVAYPINSSKGNLAVGNIGTGEARPCVNCLPIPPKAEPRSELDDIKKPKEVSAEASLSQNVAGGELVAQSPDGTLKVYCIDSKDTLSLVLNRNDRIVELFSNRRSD